MTNGETFEQIFSFYKQEKNQIPLLGAFNLPTHEIIFQNFIHREATRSQTLSAMFAFLVEMLFQNMNIFSGGLLIKSVTYDKEK